MLKIAGIQMNATRDKEKNTENAIKMACIAADKGAKVICLQELFNTHWFPYEINDEYFELAEDINGKTITAIKKVAKERGTIIIAPFFERDGDAYYNSAVVVNSNGELLGLYRKMHIPRIPLYEEKYYFNPGNLGFPIYDIGIAKIGIQICWDNFFPEGTRILALKGANIIFAPTSASSIASKPVWEKSISANAIANGVYIFRVNRVGREEKQGFYGNSFCINPEGDIVGSSSGGQEGVVICNVDLKMVDRIRKEWSFLRDRRPEVYQEIIAPHPLPYSSGRGL